jgi:hypothetical protein
LPESSSPQSENPAGGVFPSIIPRHFSQFHSIHLNQRVFGGEFSLGGSEPSHSVAFEEIVKKKFNNVLPEVYLIVLRGFSNVLPEVDTKRCIPIMF